MTTANVLYFPRKRRFDGRALRQLRERRGLTVTELAAMAYTHLDTIKRAEAGSNVPRGEVVASLARALDVPMESLFAEDGDGA